MSATATHAPVIPPRPGRSQEKASLPLIPPRPVKSRIDRSMSPNPARFAPSPLNEHVKPRESAHGSRLSIDSTNNGDIIPRSTSVDLPSLGEEGKEYAGLAAQLNSSDDQASRPEQTRTVAKDLKLYAPKPSLPVMSAKQRVLAVTRTDSDKAASFGIGRPSSVGETTPAPGSARSLKKKASTASQLSNTGSHTEDEHGIPEIGQQVPMYPHAGDVQAPSPAPGAVDVHAPKAKHHHRKTSSRGIPPGSYGLHGHGLAPQDKLEKAYYEKHPDLLKKEHTPHHHDRANDFSMSSQDLNRIVRETASRGTPVAAKNYPGCPSDEVGWQAMESTSRVASPRPKSTEIKSPFKQESSGLRNDEEAESRHLAEGEVVHIDELAQNNRKSVVFSDGDVSSTEEGDAQYSAPILAEDEVAKDPSSLDHYPAVRLESEDPSSRPSSSRGPSRPTSLYKESSFELQSTPLEDVEEYEPLFPEDEKNSIKKSESDAAKAEKKQRFPSQDIWEDAPSSVHYTAEVSTPELTEGLSKPELETTSVIPPPRDTETPAQAFARHQEELAEREAQENGTDGFIPSRNNQKPVWAQLQIHLKTELPARPGMAQRFPSRDVWEDTPDSLKLETTVSGPQEDETPESPADAKPDVPQRPQRKVSEGSTGDVQKEKPAIPERPRPKQASGDDATSTSKPVVPDRPKPHIPARPTKAGPTSGGLEPAQAAAPPRPKPAVPVRPVGSKIAALQAGFISDLNNRLRIGPQALKKEVQVEAADEAAPAEEKEKIPLSDARKGRARGPQRRAPAVKSPSPAVAAVTPSEKSALSFAFSVISTVWEIDPEDGVVSAGSAEVEHEPVKTVEVGSQCVEFESQKEEAAYEKVQDVEPHVLTEEEPVKEEPEIKEEVKTLATNMAGEPVIEEHEKKNEEGEVEETEAVEH